MDILCESPVIIFNDKFKKQFLLNGFYYKENRLVELPNYLMEKYRFEFPYYFFSKKKFHITKENLDYIYTVDALGDLIPAWIQVPCGKCDICRHKKSKEWSFRAVCETQTSETVPLFVTLTYRNDTLPKDGVVKDDLQRFLKRLRIYFDRKGVEHSLRYFACGEYGKLSGRAHYHMLLWNFPNDEESARCGIPIDIQADRILRPIWKNGFVYVRRSDFGSIFYVMKYMRKGVQAPFGQNAGFFLSSRRHGGIGALYLDMVKDYYLENPHVLKMSVVDKYTGKVFESFMPRYFRDKLFPSPSKAVPQNVIKALKMLNYSCLFRKAISDFDWCRSACVDALDFLLQEGSPHSIKIYNESELQIFDKFDSIFPFHEFVSPPPLLYLSVYYNLKVIDLDSLFKQVIQICDFLTDYLSEYCFCGDNYIVLCEKKEVFMNRLNMEMMDTTLSKEEIEYIADGLRDELRLSYLKEVI